MSTSDDLLARYTGHDVPVKFDPGFVVLSFLVSLIGAGCTLELINRRTSLKGLFNHLLLVGAAVSMGGIAIWSMHYIGNRAIIILNGEPELQIVYSSGITAASFFLPIFVLLLAFIAVGSNDDVPWWRVGLSGSLSGGATCGMHYLGNASISNYHCQYSIGNLIGASIIAVSASTIALSMFFVFRAAWTNSLLKKTGCMFLLAGAVSGMHWCASVGTKYSLVESAAAVGNGNSRTATTAVVIILSFVAALIMLLAAALTVRTKRKYANKAQLVTLAAAVFDKQGRILVSPDGLLPSEKITDAFPQKSHDDVFTTSHPLFHWMYRASRDWSSVSSLLPWMSDHIANLPRYDRDRSAVKMYEENGQLVGSYVTIFRELFCLAASSLAGKMSENVANAGTLWDEIFHTGNEIKSTITDVTTKGSIPGHFIPNGPSRLEQGLGHRHDSYGQGCIMFLVRHVENDSAVAKLEAAGFRFADTHRVVDTIKSSMQIKTHHLEEKLRTMASYAPEDGLIEPGTHVGVFAIRARLDRFGFDVLVDRQKRTALPTVRLPYRTLEQWQVDILSEFDGLYVQTLLIRLVSAKHYTPRQVDFATQLRRSITKLMSNFPDAMADNARLSSKVAQISCPPGEKGERTTCTIITLQVLLDIGSNVESPRHCFIPLQLLKVHQFILDDSLHKSAFSRALHREMAAVISYAPRGPTVVSERRQGSASNSSSTTDLCSPATSKEQVLSSGETSPSNGHHSARPPTQHGRKPSLIFGGIMVSQEIAIQVEDGTTTSPVREGFTSRSSHRSSFGRLLERGAAKATAAAKKSKLRTTCTVTPLKSQPHPGNDPLEMRECAEAGGRAILASGGDANLVDAAEKGDAEETYVDELFATCISKRRA
ncbi:Mhyt domain signaling [Apiospora aurea]|uniref:Mhyt domain signaling n=1 Tax=Apiospora aurea TaxID=335848 RepID=A0ABR1Q540_9PEZI